MVSALPGMFQYRADLENAPEMWLNYRELVTVASEVIGRHGVRSTAYGEIEKTRVAAIGIDRVPPDGAWADLFIEGVVLRMY